MFSSLPDFVEFFPSALRPGESLLLMGTHAVSLRRERNCPRPGQRLTQPGEHRQVGVKRSAVRKAVSTKNPIKSS